MSKRRKGGIGSSFDDYLKDEGTYEETSVAAIKRTLATLEAEITSRAVP